MRRKLFTLCSAVSLVLCAATWLDSHLHTQAVWCSRQTWSLCVLSTRGGIIVYASGRISRTGWLWQRHPNVKWPVSYAELFDHHAFGFAYAAGKQGSAGLAYGAAIPHWLLIGVLGLTAWRAWRRDHQSAPGLCRSCGYDLRATPERCPECGRSTDGKVAV